ncbi:MAG: hypothetical protein AAGA99_27270 [Actinomycetota bacterium]
MTRGHAVTIGRRLAAVHEGSGLTYRDVERSMWDKLGAYTPTSETLRQYTKADGKFKVDPVVLAALCQVYGVKLSDIVDGDEQLEGLVERARELLARSR